MNCYFCLHKHERTDNEKCATCVKGSNYEPKDHAHHLRVIKHEEDWF